MSPRTQFKRSRPRRLEIPYNLWRHPEAPLFHNQVEFLDQEIRAGRRGPPHPPGLYEVIEVRPGVLSVIIDPALIDAPAARRYLQDLGIEF